MIQFSTASSSAAAPRGLPRPSISRASTSTSWSSTAGKSRAVVDPVHAQPRRLSRRHQGHGSARADARAGLQIWREDRDRVRHQARARSERRACSPRPGARARRRRGPCCSPPVSPTAARRWTRNLHDDALARGLIRYCPICDGYEVTDKKVGVIGSGSHGVAEALFLRSFTADVTLIAPDKAMQARSPRTSRSSRDAGIECVDGPAQAVAISERLHRRRHRGRPLHLRQRLSGARVSDTHTQLAEMVGADALRRTAASRSTATSAPACPASMRRATSSIGLDQISHAMGEGGVAATTIRNDLCAKEPRWREPMRQCRKSEAAAKRGIRDRGRSGRRRGRRFRP